jgi:hypothetical protein
MTKHKVISDDDIRILQAFSRACQEEQWVRGEARIHNMVYLIDLKEQLCKRGLAEFAGSVSSSTGV